jgi:hypothetical protein
MRILIINFILWSIFHSSASQKRCRALNSSYRIKQHIRVVGSARGKAAGRWAEAR